EDAAQPAAEQMIVSAPSSWWRSLITSLTSLSPAFKLSIVTGAAAAAMLVIGVSWLITETVRLRVQVARLQAERQTRQGQEDRLRQQATDERAHSEDLA